MLECVPNVSEGRRRDVLDALASECGASLLDVHADADHHRAVFTLAGPGRTDAADALRRLADAVTGTLSISDHHGMHPRLGVLDVVPFVALDGTDRGEAAREATQFAEWFATEHATPVFLYGDADPHRRTLPEVRRDAFVRRSPDFGPPAAHAALGAAAVGARQPLVAVNCWLDRDDVALAHRIAGAVRERDGGLPGVRALGLAMPSRGRAQVSMNLTALSATGLEQACEEVRRRVEGAGARVERVELVGLVPASEYERCSAEFRRWSGLGPDATIEARLGAP